MTCMRLVLRAFTLATAMGALTAGSAVAAPVTPIEAPGQQSLFPGVAHAHYAYGSWQAQFGGSRYAEFERFTWPDASMVTVGSADGASLGEHGTYAIWIDPWAGAVRSRELTDQIDRGWVVSTGNREWTLRYAGEWADRRGRLIGRDLTGRVRSVTVAPKGRGRPQVILPTSRGLRLVTQSGKGLELVDRRWKRHAAYRFPKPIGLADELLTTDAEPLKDGSVVVSILYGSRSHPSRIVRLRPGRAAKVLWDGPLVRKLERAADGVVGVDDEGGVVAIDDRGRLRSRAWEELELPAAVAKCSKYRRSARGSAVATSGRALVALACGGDSPNRGVTVEFDGKARQRGAYDLAPASPTDRPEANGQRLVGASTPMADGSIPYPTVVGTPEETQPGWSTWLPLGSVAPTRGRVKVSFPPNADGRVARISVVCRGPYGRICSGLAELRVDGAVVGSQRYSLPARPGRAAATDGFEVALSTDVGTRPLELKAVPLLARPLLDPPKPAWDASIPW